MKLVAWDTSSKIGSLVAIEWDPGTPNSSFRLVSEWTLGVEAGGHSERLLWAIHQLLESCRWILHDVDVFGVGVGPGSFTGLRIGITTARTLAHTLGKPLVPISSLAALARPAALWLASQKRRTVVVATVDACKGELFALWGSARSIVDCVHLANSSDQPSVWKRGVDEEVLSPGELMKGISKKLKEGAKSRSGDAQWIAIGEGRMRYPEAWSKLPAAKELVVPIPFLEHVQGRYLGLLAWEGFQAGLGMEALQVYPRYLRASDAELKLRAGLLPKGPTRGDPSEGLG